MRQGEFGLDRRSSGLTAVTANIGDEKARQYKGGPSLLGLESETLMDRHRIRKNQRLSVFLDHFFLTEVIGRSSQGMHLIGFPFW